jgi:hypothetical protein
MLSAMQTQQHENVSVGAMNQARAEISDRLLKAHMEWNGRMLTLSSAALTLLFSFRNSYMPDQAVVGWLLPLSLGLFAASILCATLGCFHQTVCHFKVLKQFNNESIQFMDENKRLTRDDLSVAMQRSRFLNEVRPITITALSLAFFTLAMLALTLFAILNWRG